LAIKESKIGVFKPSFPYIIMRYKLSLLFLLVLLSGLVSADNTTIPACNRLPLPSWEPGACATLNETDCNNYYQWTLSFGFWIYHPWFYNQTTYNCFWNGTSCSMNDTAECDYGQYNVSVFTTTSTLCTTKLTLKQPGISVCNNEVCEDSFCMDGTRDYFVSWRYSGLLESYGKDSLWSLVYAGVVFIIAITIAMCIIILIIMAIFYAVYNLLRGNLK
jgi:hypothetical protein